MEEKIKGGPTDPKTGFAACKASELSGSSGILMTRWMARIDSMRRPN
jgi:hypothetical protein